MTDVLPFPTHKDVREWRSCSRCRVIGDLVEHHIAHRARNGDPPPTAAEILHWIRAGHR